MKLYYCAMNKVPHRDVSPLLQKLRDFLLGRELTHGLRYQDEMVSRNMPPPNLPAGDTHAIKDNYYYTRDVRREVKPPLLVADNKLTLESGGDKPAKKQLPTPGNVHMWD